jgi:hypothetical protein
MDVTASGAPRMKTIPIVKLSPCRSPVTRSGMAISQVVTVASSGGRPRCTAAEPKKFPDSCTAPYISMPVIHIAGRPSTTVQMGPNAIDACHRNTVPTTMPMKSSSSLSVLNRDPRSSRIRPVRRQTRSITPTVRGVMNSRTRAATTMFSRTSLKSNLPSTNVYTPKAATAPAMTRTRFSRSIDGSTAGGIHAGWNTACATALGCRIDAIDSLRLSHLPREPAMFSSPEPSTP